MQQQLPLQLLINGISSGALYAIVALGFGLIYNTTRIFHIAHGVIYTAAGYLLLSTLAGAKLPLWLALITSICGAALIGVLMELFIYRPLHNKNAPAPVTFVSSLGVYIILQNFIALIYGSEPQAVTTGVESAFNIKGITISRIQGLQIASFIAIFILFYLATAHTRFGKSLKAISDNPLLAAVIGIDIKKLRIGIFALGSMLAGLGAAILALDVGVDPYGGMSIVLLTVVAVIIGGVGVFQGSLVGGILIGILQAFAIGYYDAKWQNTTVFLILIAFLLLKPEGLLGLKRRLTEVRT